MKVEALGVCSKLQVASSIEMCTLSGPFASFLKEQGRAPRNVLLGKRKLLSLEEILIFYWSISRAWRHWQGVMEAIILIDRSNKLRPIAYWPITTKRRSDKSSPTCVLVCFVRAAELCRKALERLTCSCTHVRCGRSLMDQSIATMRQSTKFQACTLWL